MMSSQSITVYLSPRHACFYAAALLRWPAFGPSLKSFRCSLSIAASAFSRFPIEREKSEGVISKDTLNRPSHDFVVSRTTAGIGGIDSQEHGGHDSLENLKANRNSALVPFSASAIFDQ